MSASEPLAPKAAPAEDDFDCTDDPEWLNLARVIKHVAEVGEQALALADG